MKKADKDLEIVRLWLQTPKDKRSVTDVLIFCGWLGQNRPELLPAARYGDPYQH
jgi:hypothetical protein